MTIPATGHIAHTDSGLDIVIERSIAAPIQEVWNNIAKPDRMNKWIGTWSGEPGPGKRITFTMTAEGDAEPEEVLIHACEPPRHLAVETFQGEGSWRMTIELSEQDGVTTIRFRQHIDPATEDDISSYGIGWEYYLDRLVAVHTDTEFASWDDYYPSQQEYWAEQEKVARAS
jgi:uncharacterized protein YndB with AHSA1/START domain